MSATRSIALECGTLPARQDVALVAPVAPVPPGFRLLATRCGFINLFGPVYLHETEPVVGARVAAQHLNIQDIAHGGYLAALADSAYGIVMRRDLPDLVPRTAHLSVDYLAAVREGDWIEARVTFVKQGKRITNGTCCLTVDGRMVLQTTGVFATQRMGNGQTRARENPPRQT
ncbi:hypothetical protein LMG31506_03420 [Cupriavidus yeoncheonensis]|uniref:Thioesterase domain-containing protein n=1 Tax=Cupriavidus yeoncheonensis TaxID=1462994 RepID=A0A916IYC6_9BURK|nr:PaaI family thioesterase [Cupriavidus yeoncheonensis]CAG2146636.1 hypothetical protein LMG31506_03420 [Cupriavidus yeoncheonensis]